MESITAHAHVLHSLFFFFYLEFDECSSSPCLNGGTCTDGINNYTCTCNPSHYGKQCQLQGIENMNVVNSIKTSFV